MTSTIDLLTGAGQLAIAGPAAALTLAPAALVPDVADDRVVAWEGARQHMASRPDWTYMMSRYVHGGEPANRNGHLFRTEHLPKSHKYIPGTPTNVLHRAQHVIGATLASELLLPAADGEPENPDTAGLNFNNPFVETLGALWQQAFAQETRAVRAAFERGALWVSMECLPGFGPDGKRSEGVTCAVCGHTTAWAGYQSDTYCGHMNERMGTWLNHPLFVGTGIILPPAKPGWGEAHVTELTSIARANPEAIERIGSELTVVAHAAQLNDEEAVCIAAALAVRTGSIGTQAAPTFIPAPSTAAVAARLVAETATPTALSLHEAIHIVEAQDALEAPAAAADLNLHFTIDSPTTPGPWLHASMLLTRAMSDLPATTSESWHTHQPLSVVIDYLTNPEDGRAEVRSSYEDDYRASAFLEGPGYAAAVRGYSGSSWSVEVAATTPAYARRICDAIGLIHIPPPPPVPVDDRIPLVIWTEHPMGGGRRRRTWLRTQSWEQIQANYPQGPLDENGLGLRDKLDALASEIPSIDAGGLVVLAGAAGAGKTRWVEAALTKWGHEADVCVAADPDRLFNSASYMADVLAAGEWRRQIVVCDDVDVLMRAGPKDADIARMLNVADGLIGRASGKGTMLVLIANLTLAGIADYVTRPGRAVTLPMTAKVGPNAGKEVSVTASLEFVVFPTDEARAWAVDHGLPAEAVTGPMSLAQLYALLNANTTAA